MRRMNSSRPESDGLSVRLRCSRTAPDTRSSYGVPLLVCLVRSGLLGGCCVVRIAVRHGNFACRACIGFACTVGRCRGVYRSGGGSIRSGGGSVDHLYGDDAAERTGAGGILTANHADVVLAGHTAGTSLVSWDDSCERLFGLSVSATLHLGCGGFGGEECLHGQFLFHQGHCLVCRGRLW
jgi:hypothetical protein